MRILIAEPDDFSPKVVARLRETAEVVLEAVDRPGMARAFQAYDVVWFRLGHRIDAELLGESPRCKVLATPVTGTDHIDLAALEARGIQLACLRGETEFLKRVRATAELTIGLALSLIRHIPRAATSVESGTWNRDLFRGGELFEKKAAVIGVGRLGTIVGGYLQAMGMEVTGYDPRDDFPEGIPRARDLHALLAESDLVTLHVNYIPETRHLFGEAEFKAMKRGAVFVNTSRGGIVDEKAALAAIEVGHLGGLAVDVVEGEPHVAANHPMLEAARRHENVLVVPHIGGNTSESFEKTEMFIAEKVLAMMAKKEPQ